MTIVLADSVKQKSDYLSAQVFVVVRKSSEQEKVSCQHTVVNYSTYYVHEGLECPRLQRARRSLYTATATTDYQVMISRPRPAAALTSWILRHGVLSQFSWAQEQLDTGY